MGGQQSTRRLTVINDEAEGVIKITDNVVERIKVELEKAADETHKTAPSAPQSLPPPPQEPPKQAEPEMTAPPSQQPPLPPSPPPQAPPASPAPEQPQKPVIQYVEREPSLSSLRVKAEKEKELIEAETYWRKRFAKQEHEHTTLAHLEVATMSDTAERLSKLFAVKRSEPICQEQREEVLKCYQQNSGKPLLCSEAVKKFSSCVHSSRMASG